MDKINLIHHFFIGNKVNTSSKNIAIDNKINIDSSINPAGTVPPHVLIPSGPL